MGFVAELVMNLLIYDGIDQFIENPSSLSHLIGFFNKFDLAN